MTPHNPASPIQPWKELSRTQVFKKYSRSIDEVTFELPGGSIEKYYIKNEGHTCATLGLTDAGEVILARQFRPGPKAILLEIPGGFIGEDERQLETAQREFTEETGYTGELEYVGSCIDDAYSTVRRHCFVARHCQKVSEPEQTATEHTEVVLLSVKEFRALLRSGELTDVEVGYRCLDYLGLL
ncbi:NUDIX hydrolase [Candidatus Saccharibacteria bacterium]|nr:NUDIX hydrolase [Candidatus Saccharibacteria bacterium]